MAVVYLETSILSYLRAKPASQILSAARQFLTRRWWDKERNQYEIVISQIVLTESMQGNSELAQERLSFLKNIPLLTIEPPVFEISKALMTAQLLPEKAELDSLHIAVAAYHEVDYLLTWICKHIANARTPPRVLNIIRKLGYTPPLICTPEEMITDETDSEE